MGRPKKSDQISDATVQVMLALRASGMTIAAIAEHVGVTNHTVLYHTDPEYRQRKLAYRAQQGLVDGMTRAQWLEKWRLFAEEAIKPEQAE
jgi:predicted transcriptional regulator